MGHYVIFLFPAPSAKWPWEKIWPLSHGRTGNCMTCRRKMKSRSWWNWEGMTCRRKMKSRSWETRKGHDLQEKNEIKVIVELERPWPTEEKWDPGHEGTEKAMTYRIKMKSRPWGNWKGHDLQEKNEIQAIGNPERSWPTGEKWNSDHRENGNNMIWRFCLFRINLYLKWNFKKQFKKL